MKKNIIKVLSVLFVGLFLVTACSQSSDTETQTDETSDKKEEKAKK
jgi:ABC-type Fe3+-citrate transport system substrate-binding protein